ncbi:MAG: glycosyltransferase family 4 protein [bacterium]|nr:glycosyltransferase family 4 protein [bacterium]MDZ4284988.1 glycosyltransferase family 4 protein [Patescibacteria group bacterium]
MSKVRTHLLIVTQKVDRADPVLGFFQAWIEEFAQHWEAITVICLDEGERSVPQNVRVFCLGKSSMQQAACSKQNVRVVYCLLHAARRFVYTARFLRLIIGTHRSYDCVFVHMNAEYVVLGGIFWRLMGKRVALWYNHPARSMKVRVAAQLAHRIFYTSPQSFTARYRRKARQMPVGIDTEQFRPGRKDTSAPRPCSILILGRISVYKRLHVMIGALKLVRERGVHCVADIIGSEIPGEEDYAAKMRLEARELEQDGFIHWRAGVPHERTPQLFREHELYINASQAGNFDKTILEAMSCETMVLTSNPALAEVLPLPCRFTEGNADELVSKARYLLALPEVEKRRIGALLREYVVEHHTLAALAAEVRRQFDAL